MANLDTTLSVLIAVTDKASEPLEKIGVNVDNLKSRLKAAADPLETMKNSIQNFSNRVTQTTAPIAEFGVNVLKAMTGIAALGTAMGALAFGQAKDLEAAQKQLQKVLSDSDPPAATFVNRMRELGTEYGNSSNELLASQTAFAQAGFTAAESADLVKNSLDLVVAGDVKAAEATDYIIRSLKGFGEPASKAAELTDILSSVSIKYATSTQQLGGAIADLSPIAKQMGFTLAETAGLVTPIIEVFGSGSEASEALKTGLLQLVDDAAPVKAALQGIGVSQTDMNGQLRSGKDILLDVAKAFTTLDENTKLSVASQIAGVDQAGRLIKTFDGLNQYTEVTAVAMKSLGQTTTLVQERLSGADIVAAGTAESFRQAAEALGSQYQPAITKVIDATGSLAVAFTKSVEAGSFKGLIDAVRPQLESLENLFRQVAKNIPDAFAKIDWSRLAASIGDAGTVIAQSFNAVFGSIDITTVSGLSRTLQLVADGFATLIEFSSGFVDAIKPLFVRFGELTTFIIDNSKDWAKLAGEISGTSQVITTIIPGFADLLSGMFSIVGVVADVAFKIGLLTSAIKLLNLAGIEVLPLLGKLATAISGLNVGTALTAAAFTGLSGALFAVVAAAGGAGYAVGTLVNNVIDDIERARTASNSLMTTEQAIAEIQRYQAEQLAKQKKEKEDAQRKELEASEKQKKANEELLAQSQEQARTQAILADSFREMGLVWDANTGSLIPLNQQLGANVEISNKIKTALNDLGIDYKVVTDSITIEGQKIIGTFERISTDLTANSDVIRTALDKAVDSAKTSSELTEIQSAYDEWAIRTKASTTEVANAHALISEKLQELQEKTNQTEIAFNKLGIDSAADLNAVAQSAEAAFATIKAGSDESAASTEKIQEAFLKWAQAAIEAAAASGEIVDPSVRAQAATLGLSSAFDELVIKTNSTGKEFDALTEKYEKKIDAAQRDAGVINASLQSQRDQVEASKQIAESIGDEVTAIQAKIDIARIDADIAAAAADAKIKEAQLSDEKVQRLTLEALKQGGVSEAERIAIDTAKTLAAETQSAAAAATAMAEAADAQATAIEKSTQKIDESKTATREWVSDLKDVAIAFAQIGDQGATAFDIAGIQKFQSIVETIKSSLDNVSPLLDRIKSAVSEVALSSQGLGEGFGASTTNLQAVLREAENLAGTLDTVKGSMEETARAAAKDLRQGIADAREELRQFAREQAEALVDRQRALEDYRAEGDSLRQEEIRHAREMADIAEREALARQQGNAEALALIEQEKAAEDELHRLKMVHIRDEQQAQIESVQATADAGSATQLQAQLTSISSIKFDAANDGLRTMLTLLAQIETQGSRTAQSLRNVGGAI